MRFVDLFCGPGFATRGLMDAGLTPVLGVDNSFVALSGYRFNSRSQVMEADIGNLSGLVARKIAATRPDLVWMSPPDEMRPQVKERLWKVDEQPDALVLEAVRFAARCEPRFIVMERAAGALQLEAMRQIEALLLHYGRPDVLEISERLHAGSAQDRWRTYLIWGMRAWEAPVIGLSDRPGCAADVVDRHLPVSQKKRGLSAQCVEALARLNELGGGVLALERGAWVTLAISRMDEPHPVFTAHTQLLYVYDGGWRAPTAGEYKRLLGVSDSFDLPGKAPERHRHACHGTDARVSALIGRLLMSRASR